VHRRRRQRAGEAVQHTVPRWCADGVTSGVGPLGYAHSSPLGLTTLPRARQCRCWRLRRRASRGPPAAVGPVLHGRQLTRFGVGALARSVNQLADRVESIFVADIATAARALPTSIAAEDGVGGFVAADERMLPRRTDPGCRREAGAPLASGPGRVVGRGVTPSAQGGWTPGRRCDPGR
jgi:hypothetical protein